MRFGVLSTANIGRAAVVPAIQDSDHELVAVASREPERARAFADEVGIDRAYGAYEDLLADEDLDAVYNPLPNALHAEWTRQAADHGLDVLCEKPLGVDAEEVAEMGEYCESAGITLMEAFMYRYHPRTERVQSIVAEELGAVRGVEATFQFPLRSSPENIRLDPDLGGGSLMDVGCYAVNAARTFLGEPDRVFGTVHDSRDSGVETHASGIFEYDDGARARISSSFDTQDIQRYRIEAEDGYLVAEGAFVPRGEEGVRIEYEVNGRHVVEEFDPTDQYRLEVEHFADCVATGTTPRTDGKEAVRNMRVIDALYESADRGEAVAVSDEP
jgi:xylose dehydrogenase (NAD/NADP)